MTLYLLKIGEDIHGPFTAHQVVAYYDAGEIDGATQIVRAPADAKAFDSAVCRTVQTSGLFKSFPELRATSDNPSVYYLGQILEQQNQSTQINQQQLYWLRIVGVIVFVSWTLTQIYSCSQHR